MSNKVFLVLALCIAASAALPQKKARNDVTDLVSDCGSTGGEIVSVAMDGCDSTFDDICVVKKGETATGRMRFRPNSSSSSLECEIFGIFAGTSIEVPFPGGCPVVNACDSLSEGDCPIDAAEEFVYEMALDIKSFYPAVTLTGRWTLKDDSGARFVCFDVPIMIVS